MTRRPVPWPLLGLLLVLGAPPAAPDVATGEEEGAAAWIRRMQRALLPSDALTARARLEVRDGYGSEERIAFDLAHARRDGAAHTLVAVREPAGRAGIVYQVTDPETGPLRRWQWLPEAGRLAVVEGADRTDVFLGSELTYEDVGLATPRLRARGRVERVAADGEERVVVTAEGYPRWSRVVTTIDPASHLPETVEYYDRAGQLFRRDTYEGVREIEGRPMATRIVAENPMTGSRSVLTLGHVDLDARIPPDVFQPTAVEERLRRGESPVPEPLEEEPEG